MNDQEMEAERLIASGYCPVSNKHRILVRLDRPDWLEHMAYLHTKGFPGSAEKNRAEGVRWATAMGDSAADFYRRVYSKDAIEGVPSSVFSKVKAANRNISDYRPRIEKENV